MAAIEVQLDLFDAAERRVNDTSLACGPTCDFDWMGPEERALSSNQRLILTSGPSLDDRLPPKELRPKTNSNGTHCHATYPEIYRRDIVRLVRECGGGLPSPQLDLFR